MEGCSRSNAAVSRAGGRVHAFAGASGGVGHENGRSVFGDGGLPQAGDAEGNVHQHDDGKVGVQMRPEERELLRG